MRIITLTTDMGLKDYYVASVKGAILSELSDANIIDISHQIASFDIAQASFVIKNCYNDFPKGTIHIISISPGNSSDTKHLLVENFGHYFIGADNGIFSLLFDKLPDNIFELTIREEENTQCFPTKNVFAKAACHIARGGTPEIIGKRTTEIKKRQLFRATVENHVIKGTVAYIDGYGNIITNISKNIFQEVGKGREFRIYLTRAGYMITKIHQQYSDVPEGEKIAIFSSSGNLEIAINKGVEGSGGGANKLFGLKMNDTITIEFKEADNKTQNLTDNHDYSNS